MLSEADLARISAFFNDVEEHLKCRAEGSRHYPDSCMKAILSRYRTLVKSDVIKRLEEELLTR